MPSQITAHGDAAATVSNILASELLFRLDIVAGLICYTVFLLVPLALHKLLSPVGKGAAVLMVAFAGVLLMAGCFGYLIDFIVTALYPGYSKTLISSYITLPATFGEIGICLWLLIMGVHVSARMPKLDRDAV